MTTISWSQPVSVLGSETTYKWDWSSSPQVVNIGTSPQLILTETAEPRLINYRAEASSDTKIKIWLNTPTTGDYELDSYGGHNMAQMELMSALKVATHSGTAKIIINTASRVII